MKSMNIGLWNSTKLHIFRINDLKEDDLIISAKLKIMEVGLINDVEKLELIYCGLIMENMEKISKYIQNNDSLVFMVKKVNASADETETASHKDLQKMLQEYNDASIRPGFKELVLRSIKPETISELLEAIPELSEDLIALSILRDNNLFETILKRGVMKNQLTKHPALLICVDHLIHNSIKATTGRMRSLVQLTDEDFSESDDIEIDFNQPNVSTIDPDNIPEMGFLIRSHDRNNVTSNEEEVAIQSLFRSNIFDNVLMGVLDNQNNENGQQSLGLSSQIHQMHELGLFNDLLNFRALQIAGGNVQHAVELILNRVIE